MPEPRAREQLIPDPTREPLPPERTLPPRGGTGAAPPSPDGGPHEEAEALREDIERTRHRMSETLERIEGRIMRRRDEVWSKATLQHVRETVTSEPWRSLLIAFAAGYVWAALHD